MEMVHFDDKKMADSCHCLDQTFGAGGVRLDGEIRICWLRNSPTFLCLGPDLTIYKVSIYIYIFVIIINL